MWIPVGRKSLAEKFYMETENIPEEEGTWLILYDFKGIKPSTKYWTRARASKKQPLYLTP